MLGLSEPIHDTIRFHCEIIIRYIKFFLPGGLQTIAYIAKIAIANDTKETALKAAIKCFFFFFFQCAFPLAFPLSMFIRLIE
jgi:hypothetical protein